MNTEVQSALGFNLHAPLKTIHAYLTGLNPPMLHLLDDELIETATKEIRAENKPRKMSFSRTTSSPLCIVDDSVQREIKEKEKAIEILSRRYGKRLSRSEKLPAGVMGEEEVRQVLYAVGDNHAYLRLNCEPVERMRDMLHKYFDPRVVAEKDFSLAISNGRNGARLTHNHARQFQYGMSPYFFYPFPSPLPSSQYLIWPFWLFEGSSLTG